MIEFLALVSAVLYGSTDFFGGLTARRANTIPLSSSRNSSGSCWSLVALPFFAGRHGFIARLAGGDRRWFQQPEEVGVRLFLYRALAVGTMAVRCPDLLLRRVCRHDPGVLWFRSGRERFRPLTIAGIALAFIAIALVSQPRKSNDEEGQRSARRSFPPGVSLALLRWWLAVGLFFFFFFFFSRSPGRTTPRANWPLIAARNLRLSSCLGLSQSRLAERCRNERAGHNDGGRRSACSDVLAERFVYAQRFQSG